MTPSNEPNHDGLRHREANHGGEGGGMEDDAPGTGLDDVRLRGAAVASAGQAIIAQALSNDSTQFLNNVRQKGGQ